MNRTASRVAGVAALGWRFAALGGAVAGLAVSPLAPEAMPSPALAAIAAAAAVALTAARAGPATVAAPAWLACVALTGACAGLALGEARVAAIDLGAFRGPLGRTATATGFVAAAPSRSDGEISVRIQTADGRLLVEAPGPVAELPIGRELTATGTLRRPDGWQAAYLARYGVAQVLEARRLSLTGGRRGGLDALVDSVRDRAEAALGQGTPEPEAALLRGFLLGEADRVDPGTVEDFKRSGLAHLLAVSGDCVMLLALLGAAILSLLGVPLRTRLACVLALIAVYVPVTGAGPSIQRAGVMGAAAVVAALAGRPRSRWYALVLAALVTLALNPRTASDPSWQLSFAAVTGILVFAGGIRDVVLDASSRSSAVKRALAEGIGVTVAATLATAPLFAHYFGAISPASLPANLLALPAIPPMMWLGMLAAIAGQLPGVPVEPLTALAGLLAAYVAQVAQWLAEPGWAQVGMTLPGWGEVAAAYAVIGAAGSLALGWARRRRGHGSPLWRAAVPLKAAVAAALALALLGGGGGASGAPGRAPGLRVLVLDVGQGDSILLEPRGGRPVLVDGGPPDDGLGTHLDNLGVGALGAAIVTHDQSDHAGGIEQLLGRESIHRLLYAATAPRLLADARAARVRAAQIAEGSEVDSGALRLEVLWPPRELVVPSEAPADPNRLAVVLLARWHRFSMLLTADAEAESVPYDPGPVDVLKVAHHGSEDAGLDGLLDATAPALAVISVGAGNPYGHPSPATLAALAGHQVPVLRTDEEGDIEIDVDRRGFQVAG